MHNARAVNEPITVFHQPMKIPPNRSEFLSCTAPVTRADGMTCGYNSRCNGNTLASNKLTSGPSTVLKSACVMLGAKKLSSPLSSLPVSPIRFRSLCIAKLTYCVSTLRTALKRLVLHGWKLGRDADNNIQEVD